VEIKRRGPRIALEKVERRGLHHLSPVRLVVLFILIVISLCDLNV